jgi:integrase
MDQHFQTLKPASASRYAQSLKWLSDRFDGKYLEEIDKSELGAFEDMRRSAGVTSSTIRRDLACLSSLLTFCEDKDWIDEGKNLVPGYMRRRARRGLKEGQSRTRWLTHTEEAALLTLSAAKRFSKGPLREAMMLAIDTGLREQELFSLTWPQIDLVNRVITTTKDTKNGRARAVPMQDRSAQFLSHWKTINSASRTPTFYVFAKANGRRYQNLFRGFKALVSKAGIPEVCWHDLRRTAGCRWLQNHGKQLHQVSVLLGHSSIVVTEKSYAFLDQLQLAKDTATQFPAQSNKDYAKNPNAVRGLKNDQ